MTARTNALPWPSIDQLPRVICAKINRHFAVAESAAVYVQRWWRTLKGRDCKPIPTRAVESFAGGYGGRLHRMLLKSPVFYSEKLDGTNVGKMSDGTLLGRRQEIEPSATTYQRCPLEPLRECSTADCLQELMAALTDDESKICRGALYGELCCNFGLYDYAARSLAKTWQAFGAVFHFADVEAATAAAARGASNGFACVSDKDSPVVVVANSLTMRDLLRKHNIPAVRAEAAGSLCALVSQKKAWMTSESGEGLVVTVGGTPPHRSYKWKISREPQSSAIRSLADLRSSLASGEDKQQFRPLLAPEVHTLLSDLYDVATHVDSLAAAEAAKAASDSARTQTVDAAAVHAAIASACTKFDSLDASFAASGQAAVPKLAAMLQQEVLADKDLELPEGAKERKQAEKEVGALIKRFVGEQFGKWCALRAES
eukprot:CAMPEP_0202823012 /NCGR_PEP_ID=MMETSP1389-20130828/11472_1 /ASSEMBLY_ACC=CAM_ASM_000865 /TAXON_ID=302021 /ORGANISM="Rhodomonas sp., Strain CCMP768" /LENGTH=428 /DNA_ID=CAMNT_0049495993 /DNA_START=9 /DNA_END=1295 /DNA_ORIENTATION=+